MASMRLGPAKALRREVLFGAAALVMLSGTALAQPAAHEHTITMEAMSYGRIPTGLKVGDVLVWVNKDTVLHTITARDRSFDLRLNPGQSTRMTLQKAGKIPFYCTLHPTMRGVLDVADK
jgi:plastocyanin